MTVQIFSPQISVILRKNIGRATVAGTIAASQRFQGTARTLDLTPYLGETGSVVRLQRYPRRHGIVVGNTG
jgi:hypothetical protein